jgi:hypothetical protein
MSKRQWLFHRCSSGLMHGVMSVPAYLYHLRMEAWCIISLLALGHVLSIAIVLQLVPSQTGWCRVIARISLLLL